MTAKHWIPLFAPTGFFARR